MRAEQEDLLALTRLHYLESASQRRAAWRRSLATLAAIASDAQPVPLEGLDGDELQASMQTAMADGLFAELDWLTPASAATALFALATALPRGTEKRELGRLVLGRLHSGNAATFAALATSVATSSPRVMAGPLMRSRVALTLELPAPRAPMADALALALVSGRELVTPWLVEPSMGGLGERRLVAILLFRAAREALRRGSAGNDAGLRALHSAAASEVWNRLLTDREALAWRPIAAARGLLATVDPHLADEIAADLAAWDIGRWRRAATSMAARVACEPDRAIRDCIELMAGPSAQKDPGVIAAVVYGLVGACEEEPEAAAAIAGEAAGRGAIDALEALADVRNSCLDRDFSASAAAVARRRLATLLDHADDGIAALSAALADELKPVGERQPTLRDQIWRAVDAFAEIGPTAVAEPTRAAIAAADEQLARLVPVPIAGSVSRRLTLRALRELDRGLQENDVLPSLAVLTSASRDDAMPQIDAIAARLGSWLVSAEKLADHAVDERHPTWALLRVQTLLHRVDSQARLSAPGDGRDRGESAIATIFDRTHSNRTVQLDRILAATLARACDAAVREQSCEITDVFFAVVAGFDNPPTRAVIAEATLLPDVEALARHYQALAAHGSGDRLDKLTHLDNLLHSLPWASTPRVEAMRSALLDLTAGLHGLMESSSLEEVDDGGSVSPLARAVSGCRRLAQLSAGARRRLGLAAPAGAPLTGSAMAELRAACQAAAHQDRPDLGGALANVAAVLAIELPQAIAEAATACLEQLADLPPRRDGAPVTPRGAASFSWRGIQRHVGGFYLLRPLGRGAGGSVYLACRAEHRHQARPDLVAVKIPRYSGDHAEVLSEEEFLRLFRQEAGALLSLPHHQNLANFITFDLGARPQPVLVMEYVEGPNLAHLLEERNLSLSRAAAILEGIGSGLAAMHAADIAHLDVKPENIIVRDSVPMLVDFGLAGRHLRPGCATPHFGAPEVWQPERAEGSPTSADVYAYCCLAHEILTGRPLFDAESPTACVAAHLSHDGHPDGLLRLASGGDRMLPAVADALALGLCPRPSQRAPITRVRDALFDSLAPADARQWPLQC